MNINLHLTESIKENLATAFGHLQRANQINQEALEINKQTAKRMEKLLKKWYEDSLPCPIIKFKPKPSANNGDIHDGTVIKLANH